MYYRSRAIIIKTMDLRETDKLVTMFTEKEGKLKAVAKGIKKPKSSLRACVQPFCHSAFFFSAGRELDLVTQGKLLDFYGDVREDIKRTLYAVYMMELLDKSLMDRVALPGLYATTLAVLHYLNNVNLNLLIIRFFEMKLIMNLGFSPVLNKCVICNNKHGKFQFFSLTEGGIVCSDCARGLTEKILLSGESLSLLKLLATSNIKTIGRVRASGDALKQLEKFFEKYLEYYIERTFSLKKIILKMDND